MKINNLFASAALAFAMITASTSIAHAQPAQEPTTVGEFTVTATCNIVLDYMVPDNATVYIHLASPQKIRYRCARLTQPGSGSQRLPMDNCPQCRFQDTEAYLAQRDHLRSNDRHSMTYVSAQAGTHRLLLPAQLMNGGAVSFYMDIVTPSGIKKRTQAVNIFFHLTDAGRPFGISLCQPRPADANMCN